LLTGFTMLSFLHSRSVFHLLLAALFVASALNQAVAAEDRKLDLSHIPEAAVGAIFTFPKDLAANPDLEHLPQEVIAAVGKRDFGFNPLEAEQAIGIVTPPMPGQPPSWGVILKFSKPQTLADKLTRRMEARDLEGVKYWAPRSPMQPGVCVYEEKTVLFAPDALLQSMIANQAAESDLRSLLAEAETTANLSGVIAFAPIRELVNQMLIGAPVPPPLEPLLEIPEHLESVHLTLDLVPTSKTTLRLTGRDEKSAQRIQDILVESLAFAKQMIVAEMSRQSDPQTEDPVEQAMAAYLKRTSEAVEKRLTPSLKGEDVTLSLDMNPSYATTGVLTALLLPAVQQAREAARRTQIRNQLKQIGLAMHNYHDVYSEFPAHAIYKDKKPLLSWRVAVLPYIGQGALYEEFHLDEPWDSEHNKKLIEKMPDVYKNPNIDNGDFKTTLLLLTGPDAAFFEDEPKRIRDFTDGTSNTLLCVEADEDQGVIWTKPGDLEFDEKKPLKGLGGLRPGGFNALLCDGSVRFISVNIDLDLLRALVTPAGAEVIGAF